MVKVKMVALVVSLTLIWSAESKLAGLGRQLNLYNLSCENLNSDFPWKFQML